MAKTGLLDDKQVFPDIANAAIGLGAYEMEQIFDTQVHSLSPLVDMLSLALSFYVRIVTRRRVDSCTRL